MWWNDIKELKALYQKIHTNVLIVEEKVDALMGNSGGESCVLSDVMTRIEDVEHRLEEIKEAIDDTYLDAIKGNNTYKAYISYKPIIVNNDTTFAPADTFYFKK